jgi:hypothetical protein
VDLESVAQPYLAMNITPETLRRYYEEILDRSPLPVCYYERGAASLVAVPEDVLRGILPIRTCSWYPLTPECSAMIDRVLVDERAWLLPS